MTLLTTETLATPACPMEFLGVVPSVAFDAGRVMRVGLLLLIKEVAENPSA